MNQLTYPNDSSAMPLQNAKSGMVEGIDLFYRVLAVLRRRWLIFTAVFLFVVGAVAFFTVQQTPLYSATANLVVNTRMINIANKDQEVLPGGAAAGSAQDTAIQTEIETLKSDAVIHKIASTPRLATRPGFDKAIAKVRPEDRQEAIVGVLMKNLRVTRAGTSSVVDITFTSPDPMTAKIVADETARQYLAAKYSMRKDAAGAADVGFEKELDTLKDKVDQAQADVARYKAEHNLLSAEGNTIAEQEISIYKQQDATARADLAEERARLATARQQLLNGSKGDDVGEALNSNVINNLRNQRAQASAHLADLETRYQPNHPDVQKAQKQVDDYDRAIKEEIGRVVSNLQAKVAVASDRAAAANQTTSGAVGRLSSNNSASVKLAELELRADALKSNYSTMLERRNAIKAQALIGDNDARVMSPADFPDKPIYPNYFLNAFIGVALGLVTAALTVIILHLFDRGIVTSRDVEERLHQRHLANIPHMASIAGAGKGIQPQDYIVDHPNSMMAEAVRSLRLAISGIGTGGHHSKIVGITSAQPGEGKSTLSLTLGRVATIGKLRTILIDGDVRRPNIAKLVGAEPAVGIMDVLLDQVPLERAVFKDPRSNLIILPALPNASHAEAAFSGPMMDALLDRLRREFDLIIIDMAPALAAVDARVLLQKVDVRAMVVRWKKTSLPAVRAAFRKMEATGIHPDGVILTQVNMKALSSYGYGDIDYNYRSYTQYYQN